MKPVGHSIVSAGLGVCLWAFTNSIWAAVITFLSGILIDADHLLDLILVIRASRRTRVIIFLHAWEWALALLLAASLLSWNPIVTALAIGVSGHLLTDQIANGLPPLTYFIIYRARKRFSGPVLDPHPLNKFLTPARVGLPFGRQLLDLLTRTFSTTADLDRKSPK